MDTSKQVLKDTFETSSQMDDEDSNHLEIIKKLVDEMTVVEKQKLLNYIKGTMKPPLAPIQINNLVSFKP